MKVNLFHSRLIVASVISLSTVLSSNFCIAAQVKESDFVHGNVDSRFARAYLRNMTGVYSCDDGGTYYVRQIGNQVWWYGESGDGGATWSNVFKGTLISESTLRGTWADVPRGTNRLEGTMVVQRTGQNSFKATNKTGGFNGSNWNLKS